MSLKSKTILVTAQNAGTINGKKTTTLPTDIDKAVNGLGLDIQFVSVGSAGSNFPDQVLVTVLYQEEAKEEKAKPKK